MIQLLITEELRFTLQLLAAIEPEYVSDLILSLIEEFNGEDHPDPNDMPDPVKAAYLFWVKRRNEIIEL